MISLLPLATKTLIPIFERKLGEQRYGSALGYLRAQAYPLNEEPYRLLLTAQAGLGDLAAVHKEYKSLKALLAKEMHLAPEAETQELYRRLVDVRPFGNT